MKTYESLQSFMDQNGDIPTIMDDPSELSDVNTEFNYEPEDYISVSPKEATGLHLNTLDGQILDWDDTTVKMDVLVNKELREFQNRRFPRILFRDSNLLKQGGFIRIMMYAKSESMEIKFIDGNALVDKRLFEEDVDLTTLKSKMFEFDK